MSEAYKRLKKGIEKQGITFEEARRRIEKAETLSGTLSIEEIQRKEQELREKIKRKKEELRLNREEKLVKFKNGIRHMIDDEEKGIKHYKQLIDSVFSLDIAMSTGYTKVLKQILSEEQNHLRMLRNIMS